jgi:transaldolase
MNTLEQLRAMTTIVADTGDFKVIGAYGPRDATTNPTLILKAAAMAEYRSLLEETVRAYRGDSLDLLSDRLLVRFGCGILDHIPGRISTEVDARLAFDTEVTFARAQRLVELYGQAGIGRERILIKVAATWEGIRAAQRLEREGIRCNLTLVFGLMQAVACADAGVALVSPFVGRIYDWYRKRDGVDFSPETDPGVASVRRIYHYYKRFGYGTEVMGASFRHIGQILALAGCDLLTISPELLAALQAAHVPVTRQLDPVQAAHMVLARERFDAPSFRFSLNDDPMVCEKLAEGVRVFAADARQLDARIAQIAAA